MPDINMIQYQVPVLKLSITPEKLMKCNPHKRDNDVSNQVNQDEYVTKPSRLFAHVCQGT